MPHSLQFNHETATDAVFTCTVCGQIIGFNREGIGEPHATLVAGVWTPPTDFAVYMSPCLEG